MPCSATLVSSASSLFSAASFSTIEVVLRSALCSSCAQMTTDMSRAVWDQPSPLRATYREHPVVFRGAGEVGVDGVLRLDESRGAGRILVRNDLQSCQRFRAPSQGSDPT